MQSTSTTEKVSYLETISVGSLPVEDIRRAIDNAKRPPSLTMRITKSFIDTLTVVLSLPVTIPLFLFIAALIKLDSKGDVFFKQTRTGLDGETFEIFKFRTMTQNADKDGQAKQSQANDTRHTRMGRILRRTSLDEMPQLINIAKGEMSLIGPRPHARYHDQLFLSSVSTYSKRFRVKPGVTGWAQVNRCRGFIETHDQIADRTYYDNDYIDNWSFIKEVTILFKTVWVVIRAFNAH